uniref:Ig-like domain-containing protein n=1 Tax=Glossina palpalis gambiensis TaxID=67801 RepID=A0A1B0AS06_9MUSC
MQPRTTLLQHFSRLTTKATLIPDNRRLTLFAVGIQQSKFEEGKGNNSERNAKQEEFRFGLRISSQTDGIESAYNSIISEQLMTTAQLALADGVEICAQSLIPTLQLDLGSNLNPEDIEEGDDVYFECKVHANPAAYKVIWKHNTFTFSSQVTNPYASEKRIWQLKLAKSARKDEDTETQIVGRNILEPNHLRAQLLIVNGYEYLRTCEHNNNIKHSNNTSCVMEKTLKCSYIRERLCVKPYCNSVNFMLTYSQFTINDRKVNRASCNFQGKESVNLFQKCYNEGCAVTTENESKVRACLSMTPCERAAPKPARELFACIRMLESTLRLSNLKRRCDDIEMK